MTTAPTAGVSLPPRRVSAPAAGRGERRSDSAPHTSTALVQPLHPALTPRVRADGTILLGTDPIHGAMVTGLAEGEATRVCRLLRLLTRASVPVPAETLARACGLPAARVHEVLDAVEDAGLTLDTRSGVQGDLAAWSLARRLQGSERSLRWRPVLAVRDRRAGARVIIDGRGALVSELGRTLRAAHVAQVECGWYASAAGELAREEPDPTLIITVGTRPPVARAADWLDRSIAHLPIIGRPGSVDIGPLVVPGTGPCLACIQLHEREGQWGRDSHQELLSDSQDDRVHVEAGLASLASGTAVMLALGLIDAYPPPLGVRWHTALPLPSLATSRWRIHPGCTARAHSHAGGTQHTSKHPGEQGGRLVS